MIPQGLSEARIVSTGSGQSCPSGAGDAGPRNRGAHAEGAGAGGPSERSYARLTRYERQTIERMLDQGKGCREIAREIDRALSTVANEVGRHGFVTSLRARHGERSPDAVALAAACPHPGS